MTVCMYDAVTPGLIPINAQVVAGYIDGRYECYGAMVARFPRAVHISITTATSTAARVIDSETYDADPAQTANWVAAKIRLGARPTVYANLSRWPQVTAALAALRIPLSEVDWWAAHYTGQPHIEPGSIATQFIDTGGYDISSLTANWPNPASNPIPPQEPTMPATKLNKPAVAGWSTLDNKGYFLISADGGVFTLGDATFEGSEGGQAINAAVVGGWPTPTRKGYYLVAADGGLFTFGDAVFQGSKGGSHLNAPIVSGWSSPSGGGYFLLGADGGIFTYGDAVFEGSEAG